MGTPKNSDSSSNSVPHLGPDLEEAAQAHLAAIVESSDDAILTMTLDGVITTWNLGAANMFGYSGSEIVGKPITTLAPAHLAHEALEVLKTIASGGKVSHLETTRIRKDGTLVEVSLSVSPLRDSTGRVSQGSQGSDATSLKISAPS